MFLRIRNRLATSEEERRLVGNVFSLGLLQAANYILPLLTMPYLVRVLGPDYFGLLAFATATVMYFALISDYGFNLSATRQISIHRDDKERISEIFSSVMIIKSMLMFVSFISLVLIVTAVGKFSANRDVYLMTFGIVIGQVLFPVWLFQGIELMKYITYVNVFSKTIFTILIFALVDDKSDYILVPFFTALGSIAGGVWSLYFIINKLDYKFSWQSLDRLRSHLKDGWHVFYSSVATSLYTVSTVFILGLLTNTSVVGQFAAADKIIQAAKGLYQPVAQAIYPMVGKRFHEDKALGLHFISRIAKLVALVMFALSGSIYLFSETIVNLILGSQFSDATMLLKIMAPLPLIIALSNIFGIQVMLNLGLKKEFSRILSVSAIMGVAFSLILVPMFQGRGTAYTLLTVELFVTTVMFFYLKKHTRSWVESRAK